MRHESYGRRTTDVAVCVASLTLLVACFILVSCFIYSTILNMEELYSSETLGCLRTTLGFNPKYFIYLCIYNIIF
jgi:hypothetical protein